MKEMYSDQIEKWIDSRLEKIKSQNRQINTAQILIELQSFFRIQIDKRNEKFWKQRVLKIRKRVHKRYERKKNFCEDLAKELLLPVELIERWVRGGWIIPGTENRQQCLSLFREFEYYRRFKPEIIPQDINTSIWSI